MKNILSLIIALSVFSATSFAQTPQDIQLAIEIHQQKERIEVLDQSVTALKNEIIQAKALCPKQDGKVKFLLGSTAATMGLFAVRMFSNSMKPVEFFAYVGAMWDRFYGHHTFTIKNCRAVKSHSWKLKLALLTKISLKLASNFKTSLNETNRLLRLNARVHHLVSRRSIC
jgi:hypothetical protein